MNKTMYFLQKKNAHYIEGELARLFDLKLCYNSKKERIFKSSELLVTCKKKYISVLVYDDSDKNTVHGIENLLS